MNDAAGDTYRRRAVALLKGIGCSRIHGRLAIADNSLALEMTTELQDEGPSKPRAEAWKATVDPAWLKWVPAEGVMGMVSLAFEPVATFWDSAFALADRVDRVDPLRAALAPLRSRLNLLAAAAGRGPKPTSGHIYAA